MALIIPYTFVAGTKAKADEVNDNFKEVATEVNAQGRELNEVKSSVTNLQNNKADKNGNSNNVFRVAAPAIGIDAVNLSFLRGLSNTQLFGLAIKRPEGDNMIICEQGAAFSYEQGTTTLTDTVIKVDGSDISKAIPQGVSTGYVYLAGTNTGNTIELTISPTSPPGVPNLPAWANRYVYLGYYTTDDDGNIDSVYSAAPASGIEVQKNFGLTMGFPDYTAGVSKAWNTTHTAEEPGWLYANGYTADTFWSLTVDGQRFQMGINYDATGRTGLMVPINKGNQYIGSGGNVTSPTLVYYPFVKE